MWIPGYKISAGGEVFCDGQMGRVQRAIPAADLSVLGTRLQNAAIALYGPTPDWAAFAPRKCNTFR